MKTKKFEWLIAIALVVAVALAVPQPAMAKEGGGGASPTWDDYCTISRWNTGNVIIVIDICHTSHYTPRDNGFNMVDRKSGTIIWIPLHGGEILVHEITGLYTSHCNFDKMERCHRSYSEKTTNPATGEVFHFQWKWVDGEYVIVHVWTTQGGKK